MSAAKKSIELVEVGPRDGLQNEKILVSTRDKICLVRDLVAAGARRIEVASFVHPGRVPQMADAEAVVAGLPKSTATHIGLVLNKRGALRAFETSVDEIGVVCAATDGFGQNNQGQGWERTVAEAIEVIRLAHEVGRAVQATIAVSFGCPFEGRVQQDRVVEIARRLAIASPREVALADTIGVAGPAEVASLVAKVATAVHPLPVRVHFHDTRGTGLANVWSAVQAGAVIVDASVGGLGGCPFAPGASGNVATEDVAYMLGRSGIELGLSIPDLCKVSEWVSASLGRSPRSAAARLAHKRTQ